MWKEKKKQEEAIMDSSKRGREAMRARVIYFLDRHGQIEHPHLLRIHHFCHAGVRLRDVKRWLSELRGKDMPDSFSWSYQRRYKKGYVWQDLMDDDLLTPISDCEYVLLGSLLPGVDSNSGIFPASEMAVAPETGELDFDAGILPGEEKGMPPAKDAGGRGYSRKSSFVFRNFLTCKAADTKDSTIPAVNIHGVAGGGDMLYGRVMAKSSLARPTLRLQGPRADADLRESGAAVGGKSLRKAGRTHIPKPKCSQCGKPFNPEKLHSHMKACKGIKR
ncbi:hypothetical protein KSP40_PGU001876 [Platanthera guangdongensis]|uniref:SOSEKI DIX-like domain-containing protein n=1 Tax=Platanthera guangdongensis TaxID=2320717 RepID=A0ABR2MDE3_9ASPA